MGNWYFYEGSGDRGCLGTWNRLVSSFSMLTVSLWLPWNLPVFSAPCWSSYKYQWKKWKHEILIISISISHLALCRAGLAVLDLSKGESGGSGDLGGPTVGIFSTGAEGILSASGSSSWESVSSGFSSIFLSRVRSIFEMTKLYPGQFQETKIRK